MKIHYFQRYHGKENVHTANALLLLSRLYSYSPDLFFTFLKTNILPENIDPEISFTLQESNQKPTPPPTETELDKEDYSIPDAVISQPSFKIAIETKLHGQFTLKQLLTHLKSFENEDYRVLLTLDPAPMKIGIQREFLQALSKYNTENGTSIIHRHLTFSDLVNQLRALIGPRDYEIEAVLDDYFDYCAQSGLIQDGWQRMHVRLAGTTLRSNFALNLYYDNAEHGFSPHAYLGLYAQKSVRALGKITDIVTFDDRSGQAQYTVESGTLTDEMKGRIASAAADARDLGYDLHFERFFFVDHFHETDYRKVSSGALMGVKTFNLTELLSVKELPDTAQIADRLRALTWE